MPSPLDNEMRAALFSSRITEIRSSITIARHNLQDAVLRARVEFFCATEDLRRQLETLEQDIWQAINLGSEWSGDFTLHDKLKAEQEAAKMEEPVDIPEGSLLDRFLARRKEGAKR
jgi:hypothetical protein